MTPTHEQLWQWATPKRMENLWRKIEKVGECWLWIGAVTNDYGYAYLKIEGKDCSVPVHRLLMVLCYGADFPDELPKARHFVCDNTLCCNPRHVLVGTDADNRSDQINQDQSLRRQRISARKAAKRAKALEWLRDKQARERELHEQSVQTA